MARHKKSHVEQEGSPELDISSLIDVCFLLLIYFIVTSTITPREQDLGMALPANSPPSSEQPKIDPLFIKVEASGAISVGVGDAHQPLDSDGSSRELPLLNQQLQLYSNAAKARETILLCKSGWIRALSNNAVIDVLNALALARNFSVTFTDLIED